MGFHKPNDSSNFRDEMNLLKGMSKGSVLQLQIFDFRDSKHKKVAIYRNFTGGGDIEISTVEIEHYEDFDELISFFLSRFKIVK